jgi:26S proteasome regulatory subunit N7
MDIEKSFEQLLADKDAKIKDAEENFGETEVRDALLEKAELYNDHSKYPEAIETFNLALKRTIEIGKKMDIAFKLIGIYLKLENNHKIKENIDECYKLLEKGGDWERKNKLKVYEGIYRLIVRDFPAASKLFVDVLPTFNCPEVMTY